MNPNPISELKELCDKMSLVAPVYTIVKEEGLPHGKSFVLSVSAMTLKGEGEGRNKKQAKTEAAMNVLAKIKNEFKELLEKEQMISATKPSTNDEANLTEETKFIIIAEFYELIYRLHPQDVRKINIFPDEMKTFDEYFISLTSKFEALISKLDATLTFKTILALPPMHKTVTFVRYKNVDVLFGYGECRESQQRAQFYATARAFYMFTQAVMVQ
jgi:hypothetical protein